MTELEYLRAFATQHARVIACEKDLRQAALSGRAFAHREYLEERHERDQLFDVYWRLYGTGAPASVLLETRLSESPAPGPAAA